MSDRAIVVVDAGSTRIQCLVFDSNGKVLVQGSTPWSYVDLGVPTPYARELDADGIWDSTARLIAECVGESKVEYRRIAAITVTSQRQGVVFLDKEGRVLYAGPNTDLRAVFEGAAIDDAIVDGSSVLRGGCRPFCLRPPSCAGSCSTNRTYTTKSTGLSRWRTG